MNIRSVDIIVYALLSGDATSDHTISMARMLRKAGTFVRILSQLPIGPVPDDIRPQARRICYSDYASTADLTVLQYPIWYPLAERFPEAPGAKVFWYHGVTPPEYSEVHNRYRLENAQVRTRLAQYAHMAAVASPFMADELVRLAAYPAERIRVIPIGVDVAAFRQPPSHDARMKLSKLWGLQGKRVMLYVGRIAPHKGIDLLLEALVQLHNDYPDLHLLVVGDTKQSTIAQQLTQQLRQRSVSLGLAANITFTGRVDQIIPYFHLADVFVLPSRHEGFGIPLVEAMAAGTPVVASTSGAMPWVLDADHETDHAAGSLFSPGKVDSLAEMVREILDNTVRREWLIERGRKRAVDFDLYRFEQRCADLLTETNALSFRELPPAAMQPSSTLHVLADISKRDYQIRSNIPIVGSIITKWRQQSTIHFKESYLDPIVERQINFNRDLASGITRLQTELGELQVQQGLDGSKRERD